MTYKEFSPGDILKNYIHCYFTCETEGYVQSEDKVFATGFVEIMFNLGTGKTQTVVNDTLINESSAQLWGQTIQPLVLRSTGAHSMFGIRFFTHTAFCFLNESIDQFNNQVLDCKDVLGCSAGLLHLKLAEARCLEKRIELVEEFLIQRLSVFEKKFNKVQLVSNIMRELVQDDFFDNIENLASRYGISSRYLQKIFLRYSGLTPSLFSKINRFQKGLQLVTKQEMPLTSIAHECGYFDQSHFIKDFKSFTGSTPSSFSPGCSTELLALMNS